LTARIDHAGQTFSATFDESTGRLRVLNDSKVLHTLRPPDSWLAIAVVAQSETNAWGTRPSVADLEAFLRQYISDVQVND
jgi:hypothetical protein